MALKFFHDRFAELLKTLFYVTPKQGTIFVRVYCRVNVGDSNDALDYRCSMLRNSKIVKSVNSG